MTFKYISSWTELRWQHPRETKFTCEVPKYFEDNHKHEFLDWCDRSKGIVILYNCTDMFFEKKEDATYFKLRWC